MNKNDSLNSLFGGKNPLEGFPSIYKQKKQNTYIEDPNNDPMTETYFGRKPLEGFPSIYKKKDNKK